MNQTQTSHNINQDINPEETFKHGFYFQSAGRIIGFALTTVGFFMILSLNLLPIFIGLFVFSFGLYMISGTSGFDINYSQKAYKEYNKVLGIKFGKWKSLNSYPFMSIMTANKSNKASDITGLNKTVVTNNALGIYLLTNSHRTKVLVTRTAPKMDLAKVEAERLADLTGKELMKYNPRRLLKNR